MKKHLMFQIMKHILKENLLLFQIMKQILN